MPWLKSLRRWGSWLFRVALRSKPVDAATSLHPFVKVSFARKSLNVANFLPGTVGLNLPIAFGYSLRFEYDSDARGFGHDPE